MTISEKNRIVSETRWAPFIFVGGLAVLFFSVIWVQMPVVCWAIGLLAANAILALDFLSWYKPSKWISPTSKIAFVMFLILGPGGGVVTTTGGGAEYLQFFVLFSTCYFFSLSISRDWILRTLLLKADHTY
jgi:hypothetical protein